ncbi:hypothetical protein EOA23_29855 [Mesorhizobium sp. M2A.F.Ca.ET.042.01.1.1]|uniref:hypothetical protein n=1 Tax=Mesorhizobium sp. M2A.F.Ca.ET.042.01.1.1 TaxID=2496745 RepID=UPI000FD28951|nr:hypothetical protein [Mesorhizobium sp. M2A.F.Ca.ET.042.01.1.1]RUX19786.1 hypothetical protein EOA23_29855 [Mesorhizobium sp. M2A.F.Ca.ET.042.01.1.1]
MNDPQWHALLDTVAEILFVKGSPHSFDSLQILDLIRSPWLMEATGKRATLPELIRQSIKVAGTQPTSAISLEIDSWATTVGEIVNGTTLKVHPFGALFLLTQPFHLIVEDETSDGGFLLWVARALGRERIIQAYRAGALAFRHAGGKGQFAKSAQALSFGVWPRANAPIRSMKLRVGALLDSDDRFPNEQKNKSIADEVLNHAPWTHCLAKRTIENYIPERFLRARLGSGKEPAIQALSRLTIDQRRHFPMKSGFRDKSTPPAPQTLQEFANDLNRPAPERTLFGSVPLGDWSILREGLGDGLSQVFIDPAYRCEPRSRNLFDAQDLAELDGLLDQISKHL